MLGAVVVGLQDSVAAIVGTYYGRTRMFQDNTRTLEGTCAGIAAALLVSLLSPNLICIPLLIFAGTRLCCSLAHSKTRCAGSLPFHE